MGVDGTSSRVYCQGAYESEPEIAPLAARNGLHGEGREAASPHYLVAMRRAHDTAQPTRTPGVRAYIVDSSVWARLPKSDAVQQRVRRAIDKGEIVMPTPILLELGFTALSPAAWDALMKNYSAFRPLAPSAATHEIAMGLQGALWHGGNLRAAGAFDTLVPALAIEHDVIVIH